MNVSLTPEFDDFIQYKVSSGMYQTASEVVRDALRLLKERDDLRQKQLEQLDVEIARGLEQVQQGKLIDSDVARERLFSRRSPETL